MDCLYLISLIAAQADLRHPVLLGSLDIREGSPSLIFSLVYCEKGQ